MSSAFVFALTGLSTQAFAEIINEFMKEVEARADAGETAKQQINSVADQTEKIINDYRTVT